MKTKTSFAAAAALMAFVAVPVAAEAHPNGRAHGYWNNSAHARGHYGARDGYYRDGEYRGDVYRRGYEDDYRRRCSGTTGTVVGGGAGAILGREITRDRARGRSGTTGMIIGGALGALAGRAVDKSSCRDRRY